MNWSILGGLAIAFAWPLANLCHAEPPVAVAADEPLSASADTGAVVVSDEFDTFDADTQGETDSPNTHVALPATLSNTVDGEFDHLATEVSDAATNLCDGACQMDCGRESCACGQCRGAVGDGCQGCGRACGCGAAALLPPQGYLFPQSGALRVSGWLDGGVIGNTSSPRSKFNGPYNAVDRSNEAMFNQAYVIAEVPMAATGGIGGRIDLLYGEDFLLGQSIGFELHQNGTSHWNGREYYGVALPQAYIEMGDDLLSLKVGHFYSIVGYEGLTATSNFFYSKSYSYQFAGPFTHWGALLTSKLTDALQLQFGLHNGWNQLDGVSDNMGGLAGLKYTGDFLWSSVAVTTGKEFSNVAGLANVANGYANRTRYSWLVGTDQNALVQYVFHQWYGSQTEGAANGETARWYGIDQYLYMTLTETVRGGLRFEWFRDVDGTRVGLNRPSNPNKPPLPGDYYSVSLGLNFAPSANILIRPEVRYDWVTGGGTFPYDDGQKQHQCMLGVDGIVKF